MEKTYKEPKFEIVRQDESNKIFFTASGGGGNISNVGIASMSNSSSTPTSW